MDTTVGEKKVSKSYYTLKGYTVLEGFRDLGFKSLRAFYNVCKSVDVTFNGYELIEFFKLGRASFSFLVGLEAVLYRLRYE